jgi:hypothetical protein
MWGCAKGSVSCHCQQTDPELKGRITGAVAPFISDNLVRGWEGVQFGIEGRRVIPEAHTERL